LFASITADTGHNGKLCGKISCTVKNRQVVFFLEFSQYVQSL
jgi:hypothetical protein